MYFRVFWVVIHYGLPFGLRVYGNRTALRLMRKKHYKAHLKVFPPLPEVSKLKVPFNKPDLKELGTIFAIRFYLLIYGEGDFNGVRITPS